MLTMAQKRRNCIQGRIKLEVQFTHTMKLVFFYLVILNRVKIMILITYACMIIDIYVILKDILIKLPH